MDLIRRFTPKTLAAAVALAVSAIAANANAAGLGRINAILLSRIKARRGCADTVEHL